MHDLNGLKKEVPHLTQLPQWVYIRSNDLSEKEFYPTHDHSWHQLVYAYSGILTIQTDKTYIISPEQAAWIPKNIAHSVSSQFGAQFRSLYIQPDHENTINLDLPEKVCVLSVSKLFHEAIQHASDFDPDYEIDSKEGHVIQVIMEQLASMKEDDKYLPWPQDKRCINLCEALYQDPADSRTIEDWATTIGASSRTLSRHFEQETGITLRKWRTRLRLFRAIELLRAGRPVTDVAYTLGYQSASAFTTMFRKERGHSPSKYARKNQKSLHSSPSAV